MPSGEPRAIQDIPQNLSLIPGQGIDTSLVTMYGRHDGKPPKQNFGLRLPRCLHRPNVTRKLLRLCNVWTQHHPRTFCRLKNHGAKEPKPTNFDSSISSVAGGLVVHDCEQRRTPVEDGPHDFTAADALCRQVKMESGFGPDQSR
ncbi:hypothetical protein HBI80_054620 [Parastagonospora nodorum]|nr:hypothetical protein HBI80_054620 [Parastagonospora nodorum]